MGGNGSTTAWERRKGSTAQEEEEAHQQHSKNGRGVTEPPPPKDEKGGDEHHPTEGQRRQHHPTIESTTPKKEWNATPLQAAPPNKGEWRKDTTHKDGDESTTFNFIYLTVLQSSLVFNLTSFQRVTLFYLISSQVTNEERQHPHQGGGRQLHPEGGGASSTTPKKETVRAAPPWKSEEEATPPKRGKQQHTKEGWECNATTWFFFYHFWKNNVKLESIDIFGWNEEFPLLIQHSQCLTDGMRSPWKRCEGDWRGWFPVLQHDDQSKEHHHEGANLDLFKEFKTARVNVQEVRLELGRALTLRFAMLAVRSLSRSTERCSAREIILVMCCTHVPTGMCMSAIRGTLHQIKLLIVLKFCTVLAQLVLCWKHSAFGLAQGSWASEFVCASHWSSR